MGRMHGGDLLIALAIIVGAVYWLGVQYGKSMQQVVHERVEIVREVLREPPQQRQMTTDGRPLPLSTPSTFQMMGGITSAVIYGQRPMWLTPVGPQGVPMTPTLSYWN